VKQEERGGFALGASDSSSFEKGGAASGFEHAREGLEEEKGGV